MIVKVKAEQDATNTTNATNATNGTRDKEESRGIRASTAGNKTMWYQSDKENHSGAQSQTG